MADDRYQHLVRAVHSTAGDAFRTAFRYDSEEWSALYVRNDLSTPELRGAITDLIERGRDVDPIIPTEQYERLGGVVATVEVHEVGSLIHLQEGAASATAITVDTDADLDLIELARECRSVLARQGAVD